jgi:hypothetical protein
MRKIFGASFWAAFTTYFVPAIVDNEPSRSGATHAPPWTLRHLRPFSPV